MRYNISEVISLMKAGRILEMERYVLSRGSAAMDELAAHFDVSENTVRRDVVELIRRGAVQKVYGGVCAKQLSRSLTPYEERFTSNEEAKSAIGKAAASLVSDGDVIFIDSGTTTLQMIEYLRGKKDVSIITHNLGVINRAVPYEGLHVTVLPGTLLRETNSFTGSETVRSLQKYNIKTAFMAATGVTSRGVTNSSAKEYDIKQTAMEVSSGHVLLVDSRKFGVAGLMTYAAVNEFDTILTDRQIGNEYNEMIIGTGTKLLVAGKED